jgi:hypothetical protein
MRKSTGSYPSLTVDTTAKGIVAHAGAALLAATAGKVGLDRELSAALRPWMRPLAIPRPGGSSFGFGDLGRDRWDCLADIRPGPHRTGRVRAWSPPIRRSPGRSTPKSTDLRVYSADQIAEVATELNACPRKTLGWQTPEQQLQPAHIRLHRRTEMSPHPIREHYDSGNPSQHRVATTAGIRPCQGHTHPYGSPRRHHRDDRTQSSRTPGADHTDAPDQSPGTQQEVEPGAHPGDTRAAELLGNRRETQERPSRPSSHHRPLDMKDRGISTQFCWGPRPEVASSQPQPSPPKTWHSPRFSRLRSHFRPDSAAPILPKLN